MADSESLFQNSWHAIVCVKSLQNKAYSFIIVCKFVYFGRLLIQQIAHKLLSEKTE